MVYSIGFCDLIIKDLLIFIWAYLIYVLRFIHSNPIFSGFPHSFNIPPHPHLESIFCVPEIDFLY